MAAVTEIASEVGAVLLARLCACLAHLLHVKYCARNCKNLTTSKVQRYLASRKRIVYFGPQAN
jgi:hypothetical protein